MKKIIDIDVASEFNTIVNIGRVRGNLKSDFNSECPEFYEVIEVFVEIADYAKNVGVKLAFEPLNRYETNFINNIDEGLNFLKMLDMDDVGLLIDTFHMNIEEARFRESILNSCSKILLVHIADSNRKYPGAGHIDFKEIIFALLDIGYGGYVSGEILPWPDSDTAASKTYELVCNLLNEYSKK